MLSVSRATCGRLRLMLISGLALPYGIDRSYIQSSCWDFCRDTKLPYLPAAIKKVFILSFLSLGAGFVYVMPDGAIAYTGLWCFIRVTAFIRSTALS